MGKNHCVKCDHCHSALSFKGNNQILPLMFLFTSYVLYYLKDKILLFVIIVIFLFILKDTVALYRNGLYVCVTEEKTTK